MYHDKGFWKYLNHNRQFNVCYDEKMMVVLFIKYSFKFIKNYEVLG